MLADASAGLVHLVDQDRGGECDAVALAVPMPARPVALMRVEADAEHGTAAAWAAEQDAGGQLLCIAVARVEVPVPRLDAGFSVVEVLDIDGLGAAALVDGCDGRHCPSPLRTIPGCDLVRE